MLVHTVFYHIRQQKRNEIIANERRETEIEGNGRDRNITVAVRALAYAEIVCDCR